MNIFKNRLLIDWIQAGFEFHFSNWLVNISFPDKFKTTNLLFLLPLQDYWQSLEKNWICVGCFCIFFIMSDGKILLSNKIWRKKLHRTKWLFTDWQSAVALGKDYFGGYGLYDLRKSELRTHSYTCILVTCFPGSVAGASWLSSRAHLGYKGTACLKLAGKIKEEMNKLFLAAAAVLFRAVLIPVCSLRIKRKAYTWRLAYLFDFWKSL